MKRSHGAAAVTVAILATAALTGAEAVGQSGSPPMAAQSAGADPLPTEDPPGADAALDALAERLGITREELDKRLARDPEISDIQAVAEKVLADSFAGLWEDHADGGSINISANKEQPDQFNEISAQFPEPDLLKFHITKYSLQDLAGVQHEILAAKFPGSTSIDVPNNRVEVMPRQELTPEQRRQLEQYGDAVSISDVEYQVSTACPGRFNCAPPLRGGIAIDGEHTAGWNCTSSFPAHSDTGLSFLITAGHCEDYGDSWDHFGTKFGEITGVARYTGHADFAKIRKLKDDWGVQAIYYDAVPITSVQDESNDYIGQPVCKSGVTTGYSCGSISSRTFSPIAGGTLFRKVSDDCALQGDSGAPVVTANNVNKVAGVQSLASFNAMPFTCANENYYAYAHAGYVDDALNVTINTQ